MRKLIKQYNYVMDYVASKLKRSLKGYRTIYFNLLTIAITLWNFFIDGGLFAKLCPYINVCEFKQSTIYTIVMIIFSVTNLFLRRITDTPLGKQK